MCVSTSLLRLTRSTATTQPAIKTAIRSQSSSSGSGSSSAAPTPNIHELQSQPRSETLQKARDKAGLTADAVAQAVKNTISQQGSASTQPRQQQQGRRPAGGPSRLGSQLAARRKVGERVFDADAKAIADALGSRPQGGDFQRGEGRPRTSNFSRQQPREGAVEGARLWAPRSQGDRPPRPAGSRYGDRAQGRDSSSNASGQQRERAPRSGPRPPRTPRGAPRGGTRFAGASSENVVPSALPTNIVRPGSINLAALIARDLASRATALKDAVPVTPAAEASQAERLTHRKERAGDYSRWAQAFAEGDKKKIGTSFLHAEQLLSLNPSIGLAGRKVFLDKIAELTRVGKQPKGK